MDGGVKGGLDHAEMIILSLDVQGGVLPPTSRLIKKQAGRG